MLAVYLHVLIGGPVLADPLSPAIGLETGALTHGIDSSGNGTVTGSKGLNYPYNYQYTREDSNL